MEVEMKIAIGNDHAGVDLKEKVADFLKSKGYEVENVGTDTKESVDYPDIARKVAKLVNDKECEFGIVICGTGIGISIAANKVPGIRCALCHNSFTAKLSRLHNNSNVLSLGARVIGDELALDIVDAYLTTDFEGGRHARRVDKIEEC